MTQIEEESANITSEYNPYGTVTESSPQTYPQNKILIIFSLALMVAIGISAYLFLQNQSLKNQLTPSVTCEYAGEAYAVGEGFTASDGCNSCSCTETGEVACTAMACLDDDDLTQSETDEWETYSSDSGYSFKAPSTLVKVEEIDDQSSKCTIVSINNVKLFITDQSNGRFCGTTGVDTPNRTSQADFSFSVLGNEYNDIPIFEYDVDQFQTLSRMVFISDLSEDIRIQILGEYSNSTEQQQFYNSIEILNQILSTFEFIDQNDTSSKNLKTYSDANKTFSFQYPSRLEPHECRPTQLVAQDPTLILSVFFPNNSQPSFSEYCDSPITDDLQIRYSSSEIPEELFLTNDYALTTTIINKGDMKLTRVDAEKSEEIPGPSRWTFVKFVSKNNHYMLVTDYALLSEAEIDQILSTFEFIN